MTDDIKRETCDSVAKVIINQDSCGSAAEQKLSYQVTDARRDEWMNEFISHTCGYEDSRIAE